MVASIEVETHDRVTTVVIDRPEIRNAIDGPTAGALVDDGQARASAEELARELTRHPQTCLRSDRLGAYEQWGMPLEAALRNEFRRGLGALASGEALAGARDFAAGRRRDGEG